MFIFILWNYGHLEWTNSQIVCDIYFAAKRRFLIANVTCVKTNISIRSAKKEDLIYQRVAPFILNRWNEMKTLFCSCFYFEHLCLRILKSSVHWAAMNIIVFDFKTLKIQLKWQCGETSIGSAEKAISKVLFIIASPISVPNKRMTHYFCNYDFESVNCYKVIDQALLLFDSTVQWKTVWHLRMVNMTTVGWEKKYKSLNW